MASSTHRGASLAGVRVLWKDACVCDCQMVETMIPKELEILCCKKKPRPGASHGRDSPRKGLQSSDHLPDHLAEETGAETVIDQ